MNRTYVAAKRSIERAPSFTGLIKGQASLAPGEGLVPGYSASGQDVWVPSHLTTVAQPGLVLSSVGARCGKVFLSDHLRWGTVANTSSWFARAGWDLHFLHYFFNREDFWIKGGSAQPYVQEQASLCQPMVQFSPAEQRAIADFLDRETAKVDALVAEQEGLVQVLRERRQAFIDWVIGRVDAPRAPLRRFIAFLTSGSRGWGDYYADQGERFLRIANLPRTNLSLRGEVQHVTLPDGVTEGARTRLRNGDLLFSITAYLGSVAIVDPEWVDGYVSQHVALCRFNGNLDSRFVGWSMLATSGQNQLKEGAFGGTKQQLALDDLRALTVFVPSSKEQREISNYLDKETRRIDALIAEAEGVVAVARERRTALITAAVTGQIDVRGEVA